MKSDKAGSLLRKKAIAAAATVVYIFAILGVIVIGSLEQRTRSGNDLEHIAVSYIALRDAANSPACISFDTLENDIVRLKDDGYVSVLPKYYIDAEFGEQRKLSKTAMLLFEYENSEKAERILKLLGEYGFRGVFIVDTEEMELLNCNALIEAVKHGSADICLRTDGDDMGAVEAITAMSSADSIYRAAERLSYAGMISSIRFGVRPISCMRSGGGIDAAAELAKACGYSVLMHYGDGEIMKNGQTVIVCCKIRMNGEAL